MTEIENEPIVRFFLELQKVKDDHRSLVLVTNGVLELFIETLIKARCKNAKRITGDSRSYPYSAKLLLLNESGVLDDAWYAPLDMFRKLRNRAAHEPFFSVTAADLRHLTNERLSNPEDLPNLCSDILAGFWNAHLEVFGPVFAPKVVGAGDDQPTVEGTA